MPQQTTRYLHGDKVACATYLTLEDERDLRMLAAVRGIGKSELQRDLIRKELEKARKKGEV